MTIMVKTPGSVAIEIVEVVVGDGFGGQARAEIFGSRVRTFG
jgi:hypothetical protein